MFERFSDPARRVVVLAQEEASGLGHDYIGSEHLLLGVIAQDTDPAAEALKGLGVTLDGVRHQVEEIIGRGTGPHTSQFPFTPRAKRILEMSLREAVQRGHQHIGPGHILLAIVGEHGGVAAGILAKSGANATVIREQMEQRFRDDPETATAARGGDTTWSESAEQRLMAVHVRRLQADWREIMPLLDAIDQRLTAIEQHLGIIAESQRGEEGQEARGNAAQ